MKTKEYAPTKSMKDALALAVKLTKAEDSAIGEITGETGTGKTAAGRHILRSLDKTYRVCLHKGMSPHKLMKTIARKVLGEKPGASDEWEEKLTEFAESDEARRPLLIIDEGNAGTWNLFERLRHVADECGFAVLLLGTELYTQQFKDARTAPLLLQLGRRIGAKRVKLKHMDRAETLVHVIKPRFGDVDLKVATEFWKACRKGNWGEAVELADACKRLMEANPQYTQLNQIVLNSAMADLANAQTVNLGGEED